MALINKMEKINRNSKVHMEVFSQYGGIFGYRRILYNKKSQGAFQAPRPKQEYQER